MLKARITATGIIRPGMSVLCLAARLGTEVRAFRDFGCFAVGLDINPGPENKYVVHGDFHHVQFASGSVDVVFTNSLDHGLQPEKILREVARVLKPGGLFVLEASGGTEDEAAEPPEEWEAFYWSSVDKLAAFIEGFSFRLLTRHVFTEPNPGEHLCFVSEPPVPAKATPAYTS